LASSLALYGERPATEGRVFIERQCSRLIAGIESSWRFAESNVVPQLRVAFEAVRGGSEPDAGDYLDLVDAVHGVATSEFENIGSADPVRSVYFLIGSLGLFWICLGVMGFRYASRQISHPIASLSRRTQSLLLKSQKLPEVPGAPPEVHSLRQTLNVLVKHRLSTDARRLRELELCVARLESELADAATTAQCFHNEKDQAIAANRAKSDFLASMSHEIRVPMTAILGYADLVLDGQLSREQIVEHIQVIRQNGMHLMSILNDILDHSKIEAGKMSLEISRASTVEIVRDVISLMRARANAKGLSLLAENVGEIPTTIETDPTRLRQILLNLIGNAIKFTREGSIRLVVNVIEPIFEDESHRICFDVIDSGMGRTEAERSRVLEIFSQADSSIARRFGGSGLGLSIAKRLAEMLGGAIHVQTKKNVGTSIIVWVPLGDIDDAEMCSDLSAEIARSEAKDEQNAVQRSKLSGRVLVADDVEVNRGLVRQLLSRHGIDVVLVENGQEAVDTALHASDEGQPFDLVLLDMQMPVLDGYGAARSLRGLGYRHPIVALTADVMGRDRERSRNAGCDDHLAKPIERDRLYSVLCRYLEREGGSPSSSLTTEPASDRMASVEKARTEAKRGAEFRASETAIIGPESEFYAGDVARSDDGIEELVVRASSIDPDVLPLMGEFLTWLKSRSEHLQGLVEGDDVDLPTVNSVAHEMKGAAGSYGIPPVSDAARLVEELSEDATEIEPVRDAAEKLIELVSKVRFDGDLTPSV
ncbi:MAG: ATP-binding protein, partial [Planctomycetota bacterium]